MSSKFVESYERLTGGTVPSLLTAPFVTLCGRNRVYWHYSLLRVRT